MAFPLRSYLKIGFCLFAFALILNFEEPTISLAQDSPPTFTKAFLPDTIGPGSVSTLQFIVDNSFSATPVTDLAFTDTLPAGVMIATPSNMTNSCTGGTLLVLDDGIGITYSDGMVAGSSICTITVDVTSSLVGLHTNTSGDLTSSAGNSGSATDDLIVAANRLGFSKSFAPSLVNLGGRSTLTFTVDNTANESGVTYLAFTDNLPIGLEIASPANTSTTCGGFDLTLTATSGTSVVSLTASGAAFPGFEVVIAGGICTVTVDVAATGVGMLVNSSGELTFRSGNDFTIFSSGKANAALEVTADKIQLTKAFTDDPIPPGGTATLEFNITNFDRANAATAIAFTDDLAATLVGLTFSSLRSNDCGGAISGVGTTTIAFSGGTLAAETSCTITVDLSVPAGATSGIYSNVTNAITATIGGFGVTGNMASDNLFVEPFPILTKEFLDATTLASDPVVGADESVKLRFVITNSSPTSAMTDIAFTDIFDEIIQTASAPPTSDCGGTALFTPLINPPPPDDAIPATLTLTGGALAAGASCTIDITLDIFTGAATGSYLNTTSTILGTVDRETVEGNPAFDVLEVVAAPSLIKAFLATPVLPGDSVSLEFVLSYDELAPGDASNITFTDDLAAVVAGLTATGLPLTDLCGPGNGTLTGSVGDTFLTFSGGTLTPGEVCTFSVALAVPGTAPIGSHTNTTSQVTATVLGVSTTENAASDDLLISNLIFSKEFTDDPVIAGDTVTLEFTIDNIGPSDPAFDATGISFTDNLAATLPGTPDLSIVSALPASFCGGTLSAIGATFLFFTGGSVSANTSCSFSITLQAPAGTTDGTYINTTSGLTAIIDSNPAVLDLATDGLIVDSTRLAFSKEFTDDPVEPGGNATLQFTLENLNSAQAASNIAFTDNLDAALSGLTFSSMLLNDCGGSVSGVGTTMITFTGGSLAAGASCTISVSLTVPSNGSLSAAVINVTSQVTGDIGGFSVFGNLATDVLAINTLRFSKAFDGPTTATGNPALTFTIENLDSTAAINELAFVDDLDATLSGLVATGLPLTDICGTGSQISGTSFLLFSGGSLLPGGSCTFDVPLRVPGTAATGHYTNTTSNLFSAGLNKSAPAVATLTIEPAPTFSKVFTPDEIGTGQISTLVFTIDNAVSALATSSLDFTDNLPAGIVVATPANESATCSGTLIASSGTSVISYSGGSVSAGASCTVSVDVTSNATGIHINTTGDLTSSSGNSGTAMATLTVGPPLTFNKRFEPNTVPVHNTATLTFTLDNSTNALIANNLAFTDTLPSNLVIANPANMVNTCTGGILNTVSGNDIITYNDGIISAGAICTIQVDVMSSVKGTYLNTTSGLFSSLGVSSAATATLAVEAPPHFTLQLNPAIIAVDEISSLTYTIDNLANTLIASSLTLTSNLPTGVVIANPANAATTCTGGALSVSTGASNINYTNGIASGATACVITVDVIGTITSTVIITGNLSSSFGASDIATGTLTIQDLSTTYLPLVLHKKSSMQDLVIDTLVASSDQITITIRNAGKAAINDVFWVQVSINPSTPPNDVNQQWNTLGNQFGETAQGAFWGIITPAVPLDPGGTIALTLNDRFYYQGDPANNVPNPIPEGSIIYAQVDAVNFATTYGNVLEMNETNNITQTSSISSSPTLQSAPGTKIVPFIEGGLPALAY